MNFLPSLYLAASKSKTSLFFIGVSLLIHIFPLPAPAMDKIDYLYETGAQDREELKSPADMSVSPSGRLYLTDMANKRVLIYNPEGKQTGAFGEKDVLKTPWGIAHSESGNVYITDSSSHRVVVYDKENNYLFSFGRQGKKDGELSSPQGIAIDSQGRVIVADSGNSSICFFTLDGIFLGRFGSRGSAEGQFERPSDLAVDIMDNIYVTDEKAGRIQVFSFDLKPLKTYEKKDKDDKAFGIPVGVDADRFGRVFYSDGFNNQIHVAGTQGGELSVFGSEGKGRGQFRKPTSLAYDDKTDRLFVADTLNSRIQVFQIGLPPDARPIPTADSRDRIEFSQTFTTDATAITVARDGTLYTLNAKENKVEKRRADGTVIAEFSRDEKDKDFLAQAEKVFISTEGLLYISDSKNDTIYVIDSSGKRLFQIGSRGTKDGSLQNPKGIAELEGNIVVADSGNNRIQLFNKDGIFLKSFGKKGNGSTEFNNPSDVAVNSKGEIWVSDSGNHRIQVFDREARHLRTIGSQKNSPDDKLYKPMDLEIDRYDNVYVSDGSPTYRVQVFNSGAEALYSFGSKGSDNHEFNNITDIHLHFNGNQKLYIIDGGNGRLKMLSLKKTPFVPAGFAINSDELYSELSWLVGEEHLVEKYCVFAKAEGEDFQIIAEVSDSSLRIERSKSPGFLTYAISAVSFDGLSSRKSTSLTDHFGIAYDYFKSGKYSDAISHFEQVENRGGKAWLYLGESYVAAKDLRKAEDSFKKLSQTEGFEDEGFILLGRLYLDKKDLDSAQSALESIPKDSSKYRRARRYLGEVYYEKGLYDSAIEFLTEAVEQGDDDARACGLLGAIYFKLKVFDKSILFYKKALQKEPENPILHAGLASVYEANGQKEEAVSRYSKVVTIDPSNLDALLKLAGLYSSAGDWPKAESTVETALGLEPENLEALSIKGNILLNKGQYSEAIILFRKILASRPEHRAALYAISKAYTNIGQTDEALLNLQKLSGLKPVNPDSLYLMARLLQEKGERDKALEALGLCIDAAPDGIDCHQLKASIHISSGELDMALGHLETISRQSPGNSSARMALVDVLRRLGKTGEAIVELEELARLDRKNAEARYVLGQIYMENKQVKKALDMYSLAAELDPSRADYLNALGLAYLNMVKINDAIELFKKAISIDAKEEYRQNLNIAYEKKKTMLASSEEAPPLAISEIKLQNIFASAYKNYAENPMGFIKLQNNSDETYQKIKVSLNVKKYMDFPSETIISELKPHETAEIPVSPTFNNELLGLTEDTKMQAEIQVDYFREKKPATLIRTEIFHIYNRNALTWSIKDMAAAFITPNDPPVVGFARHVIQQFHDSERVLDENLNKAIQIFDALGAFGVVYLVDPNSAYSSVSIDEQKIDSVQYPRDTLKHKAGDCDDLSVLYAAMLENLGVETALLDVPGHLFMAFRTATPVSDKENIASSGNLYVIRKDGYVWIPVEVTMLGKSFTEAWYEGAKELKTRKEAGELNYIDTKKSWEKFKPVTLDGGLEMEFPSREAVLKLLQKDTELQKKKDVEKLAKKHLDRLVEDPQDYNARLNLGIIYGKNAYYAEAKAIFEALIQENAGDLNALNGMGNILFAQGQYEAALEIYSQAERSGGDNAELKMNISLVMYKLGRLDGARDKFREGESLSTETVGRFSLLKSLLFD